MLVVLQRKLVFVGHGQRVAQPLSATLLEMPDDHAFDVSVATEDGLALNGWGVLAEQAESLQAGLGEQRPVILYFSGNAANRLKRARAIRLFQEIGADVFLVDYRGYADNPGSPSEEAFAADAKACWRHLTETLGVPAERVVVFGESLGGGVATRLAAELCEAGTPPAGLMLRATFASLVETAAYHYPFVPVRMVLKDRFPSVERIPKVTCPIIHFHGDHDRIVPYVHGRELVAAAPAESESGVAKKFVTLTKTGHNDILYVAYEQVQSESERFLREIELLK